MSKVKIRDAYNNELMGTIVKIGRKYVYVEIDWQYWTEIVPFERTSGRTAQGYEESKNALPMFIQK